MTFRIFYIDGSGKEVGYWGHAASTQLMIQRLLEFGVNLNQITSLKIKKDGEKEYQTYDPGFLAVLQLSVMNKPKVHNQGGGSTARY